MVLLLLPGEGDIMRTGCQQHTPQISSARAAAARPIQFVIPGNLLYHTLWGIQNCHLNLEFVEQLYHVVHLMLIIFYSCWRVDGECLN